MIQLILSSLWFFLPAGCANVTPIIFGKLPLFKQYSYPLDFNLKYKGTRIFGDHKTIRGLISGILAAIVIVNLQIFLYKNNSFFHNISPIDYLKINPGLLGFLFGFGALGGDFVKSFFKRRFLIDSGKSWFFFDQSDYIIGGILLSLTYVQIPTIYYLIIYVVWFFLHIISSLIGFFLKFKNVPL